MDLHYGETAKQRGDSGDNTWCEQGVQYVQIEQCLYAFVCVSGFVRVFYIEVFI